MYSLFCWPEVVHWNMLYQLYPLNLICKVVLGRQPMPCGRPKLCLSG